MKVGIILTSIGVLPGYEKNVSGHVQIPLRTAELLRDAGHEVHLIATRISDATSLPAWVPDRCAIHMVTDGRKRGVLADITQARKVNGVRPWKLAQQLYEMWSIARRNRLDILHFFGFERMVRLAGIFRLSAPRMPIIASVMGGPAPISKWQFLYRRVNAIVTATTNIQRQWEAMGVPVVRAPHGILRDFSEELASDDLARSERRHRVLFWREADHFSGADTCIAAFDRVAKHYPDVTFTFALRKNNEEVEGLDELAQRHANVEIYRFPYPDGVSLAKLISESICAVLPFRDVTIQPQLTVAETLAAGVPVITTRVESLPELISDGENGLLVPPGNSQALTAAIHDLLTDQRRAKAMGEWACEHFHHQWNWPAYMESLERVYRQHCRGDWGLTRPPSERVETPIRDQVGSTAAS